MKIVIVGGVAGGASAAARARRLDESAEIIMFERGPDPSFANCGLPYYVGGEIESRDKLLVAPVSLLKNRLNLDVRVLEEVVSIDREKKLVRVRRLETGKEYEETYDKLILAPGAAPIRPPIPGIDAPKIYTLRNLVDADKLQAATLSAKRAVIIGGGFIGLEMAENLVRRGLETTLIERNPQVLTPWDAEMVLPIADTLRKAGVDLRLGDEAVAFEEGPDGVAVTLKGGDVLNTDFVVLSIGVHPENTLAKEAGLEIGQRGGISVSPNMQTSDPDIYAVGDAVEVIYFPTGTPIQIPLAGPANRQGRIAADAIFGRDSTFRGVQGTAVVGVMDRTAAMTGLSEKACHAMNIPYEKIYLHPANHAGYYPGAEGMSIKLLFHPGESQEGGPEQGEILGAQAVGGAGVDKRIDVIATAIQAGMSVYDLEEIELCYAPQYGSAKDPINMAGFIASGVLRGDQPIVHAEDLLASPDRVTILDVRTPKENEAGAVPGAINISVDELRERLDEVPNDQPVIVYCMVGMRGYLASRILMENGYEVRNLSGGYKTYAAVVAARTPVAV